MCTTCKAPAFGEALLVDGRGVVVRRGAGLDVLRGAGVPTLRFAVGVLDGAREAVRRGATVTRADGVGVGRSLRASARLGAPVERLKGSDEEAQPCTATVRTLTAASFHAFARMASPPR
jgi:hypothetical protein